MSSEKKPGFWQRLFGIGAQEPPKEEPAPPKPAKKEPPAPKPAQKEPPKQKQPAKKAAKLKAPPPAGPHVAKDEAGPLTGAPRAPSLVAGNARASRNPRRRQLRHRRQVLPRRRERVRPRNDTLPRGKKAHRTSPVSLSLPQSPRNQRTASPRKPQLPRRTPSEAGSRGSARGSPGALPLSATILLRC